MRDYLKFRLAIWLLKDIHKEHLGFRNKWNSHVSELESLYPSHNEPEFCEFCNGKCKS